MKNPGKKILIIEDDAQDQKIIKLNLVKHGYENLIFASTGEEGIVKAKFEKPDLIILDINLPQMNGVEVRMALEKDPAMSQIPIIFLTNLLKIDGLKDDKTYTFVAKYSIPINLVQAVRSIFGS